MLMVWLGEEVEEVLGRPAPSEVGFVYILLVDVVSEGVAIAGPNLVVKLVALTSEKLALGVAEVFGVW